MNLVIEDKIPELDDFIRLRNVSGLSFKSREAARKGLPHTLFGVVAYTENNRAIGMGRVVGDGGTCFTICDIAIDPDYQGKGVGKLIMERILGYIEHNVPQTAFVNMIADKPGFYEKFGFKRTAPEAVGMYIRKE